MSSFGTRTSGLFGGESLVSCQIICCFNCGVEVLDSGTCSTVRCAVNNCASGSYSGSFGGQCNTSSGYGSVVLGGDKNIAQATNSFVGGGRCNNVCNSVSENNGFGSVVVGGVGNNTIGGTYNFTSNCFSVAPTICNSGARTFIGGGFQNKTSANSSAVVGGYQNTASAIYTFIGGGAVNNATTSYATVGGGFCNNALGNGSFVGGGNCNFSCLCTSTIGGGRCNIANACYSFIGAGFRNTVSGYFASLSGSGRDNSATNTGANVNGGRSNTASGVYSVIGGGLSNTASSCYSAILGGTNNNTSTFGSAMIIGSNLTATQACTTFTNCLSANNLTQGCFVCVGANKVLVNSPLPVNLGLFAQTGNSTPITATTLEGTLIDGGVGTLSVPANGFVVGDSFVASLSGLMSAKNNDTITIRVKSGSVVLADSGALTLPTIANQVWSLGIEFTVRTLGGAGVASIVTLGQLHILKFASGTQEGFGFNSVNTTTFDTTVTNTLNITAEWSSNSASNSIYTDLFVLNKSY